MAEHDKALERKTEEVHVSAFVEKGTAVVLIEAPTLRRLQAENKVLLKMAKQMSETLWLEHERTRYPGFEKAEDFEAEVQAELNGERKDV